MIWARSIDIDESLLCHVLYNRRSDNFWAAIRRGNNDIKTPHTGSYRNSKFTMGKTPSWFETVLHGSAACI